MMQQPGAYQQQSPLQHAFTTAGYSHPTYATSSPTQFSPPGNGPIQQQQMRASGVGPQKSSMAAPAIPRGSQQQSPRTSTNSSSQPQSPLTPTANPREKERISLLLDINVELLQEISTLQAQGKGGAQTPQQAEMFRKQGLPDKMASEEYIQTLYRLHANLGYLCGLSDLAQLKPDQKPPHPPNFMKPPPNMPGLEAKYSTLRELFPGWIGRDNQVSDHANGAAIQQ